MILITYKASPLDMQTLSLYSAGMNFIKKASEIIFTRLAWQTAKQDQAGIAEKLADQRQL
jgi:hypothetical protein